MQDDLRYRTILLLALREPEKAHREKFSDRYPVSFTLPPAMFFDRSILPPNWEKSLLTIRHAVRSYPTT